VDAAAGVVSKGSSSADDFFSPPQAGTRAASNWVNNSSHAADHIAAGSIETAMQLLNRQIALVNFEPLKPKFIGVFCGAVTSLPGLALSPSMLVNVQRTSPTEKGLPSICLRLPWLIETLKAAYKFFHMGSFTESLEAFKAIVHGVPLVVTMSRSEGSEVTCVFL
jgi:coatomer subunit alpha